MILTRLADRSEPYLSLFSKAAGGQLVTLPSLSVTYLSLRDKHATLITQLSSPSLHKLMSTNIRSFHVHFSIGILCLLKSQSTRCLQASQLIWSTKPWHSSGKGSCWIFAKEPKNVHWKISDQRQLHNRHSIITQEGTTALQLGLHCHLVLLTACSYWPVITSQCFMSVSFNSCSLWFPLTVSVTRSD